jgi:hypothetical protein
MTCVCWFSLHEILLESLNTHVPLSKAKWINKYKHRQKKKSNTVKVKKKQNRSAREREGVRPRERERGGGAPERKELLRDGGPAMLVAATVEGMWLLGGRRGRFGRVRRRRCSVMVLFRLLFYSSVSFFYFCLVHWVLFRNGDLCGL